MQEARSQTLRGGPGPPVRSDLPISRHCDVVWAVNICHSSQHKIQAVRNRRVDEKEPQNNS